MFFHGGKILVPTETTTKSLLMAKSSNEKHHNLICECLISPPPKKKWGIYYLWTPKPWKMKVLGPQYMGNNPKKWSFGFPWYTYPVVTKPSLGCRSSTPATYQPTVHPVAHLGTIHLHHATFKETTTTTQALQGTCLGKQGEAEGRTVVDAGWHWWKMERWFLLGQDDF